MNKKREKKFRDFSNTMIFYLKDKYFLSTNHLERQNLRIKKSNSFCMFVCDCLELRNTHTHMLTYIQQENKRM